MKASSWFAPTGSVTATGSDGGSGAVLGVGVSSREGDWLSGVTVSSDDASVSSGFPFLRGKVTYEHGELNVEDPGDAAADSDGDENSESGRVTSRVDGSSRPSQEDEDGLPGLAAWITFGLTCLESSFLLEEHDLIEDRVSGVWYFWRSHNWVSFCKVLYACNMVKYLSIVCVLVGPSKI